MRKQGTPGGHFTAIDRILAKTVDGNAGSLSPMLTYVRPMPSWRTYGCRTKANCGDTPIKSRFPAGVFFLARNGKAVGPFTSRSKWRCELRQTYRRNGLLWSTGILHTNSSHIPVSRLGTDREPNQEQLERTDHTAF